MKKSSVILLCAAAVCIVIGLCFCSAAVSVAGGNIANFCTEKKYVKKTAEYSKEDITSLDFTDISNDVRIVSSRDSMLRITYYETDKIYYSSNAAGGTLTVKYHSNAKWYDNIGIFINSQDTTVVIEVPEGFDNIGVQTTSGDIHFDSVSGLSLLKIKSTSGDVTLTSASIPSLDIRTTSGDIEAESLETEDAYIASTSGDVEVQSLSSPTAEIKTVSGEIEIERADVSEKFTASSTSGEIKISSSSNAGTVKCEALSGNIWLDISSCRNANLKTTSGNIKMTIDHTEDYRVTTSTVSGDVRVPASARGEKEIYAKTTSGNINISEK